VTAQLLTPDETWRIAANVARAAAPVDGGLDALAVAPAACGYAMANAGHDTRLIQDWLGHRAIQHTARYTELSPVRFKDVWR
jgi:site-specific recombinase XerD